MYYIFTTFTYAISVSQTRASFTVTTFTGRFRNYTTHSFAQFMLKSILHHNLSIAVANCSSNLPLMNINIEVMATYK